MAYGFSVEDEIHWRSVAKPLPRLVKEIEVGVVVRDDEDIAVNLLPGEMEDKWIVLLDPEEPWIDFHRSWTGFLIYRAYFEIAPSGDTFFRRALVSRDPEQYTETDDAYDSAILRWLIRALLCGQDVPFPLNPSLTGDAAVLAGWSVGGSAAFASPPPDPPRPPPDRR